MLPGPDGNGFPQFDKHEPSGATISGQASKVAKSADEFEGVADQVVTRHNNAKNGVHGELRIAMDPAAMGAQTQMKLMAQRASAAGKALTAFGDAVDRFNSHVEKLNTQIADSKDRKEARETYENMKSEYNRLGDTLKEAADDACGKLDDWANTTTSASKVLAIGSTALGLLGSQAEKGSKLNKLSKFGGPILGGGGSAIDQFMEDSDRDDLNMTHKITRAAFRGVSSALGGAAGGKAGIALGRLTGPAAPVASPLFGAALGAAGGWAGDKIGEDSIDVGAADWTADRIDDGLDWRGDHIDDATDKAGEVGEWAGGKAAQGASKVGETVGDLAGKVGGKLPGF